ncbi:hypothetical protein H8A00_07890 [Neisseria meningitidis]|nr:hypothetical protein [Neisseria meningitidis]MBG9199390.1 hypothetical protein [Neisseria meningitidis]MBJ1807537.1 hypothetical protein [Neisseria meningitidis]RNJ81989.1 hypothetical protein COI38_05545 [Neisseria meningitidis]
MLEFRETYESSFPRRREFGISMPQEFIGKNQNPSAVIPTKVGIWNFNASRIYRKKSKPFRRHSHESGNLEMKSSRNLSETTETERTGFPPARE